MRALTRALGVASLLLAAASFRLWYVYAYTRPHFAYPEYGQIYEMTANGWTVYLTRTEQVQLYAMTGLAILSLVGAVTLDLLVTGRKERSDNSSRSER